MNQSVPILYEDNRILVCLKPPGVVSTDQPGGLPGLLREQLGGGALCLRTVHRLDKPVGGVMVLARSREAARRLSRQVEEHSFRKEYWAVLNGQPEEPSGRLVDLLGYDRSTRTAYTAQEPGKEVREAALRYTVLGHTDGLTLVSVLLETGRTHQIRIQFASRALPLAGDEKYGAPPMEMEGIGLWARSLSFAHPQTGEKLTFAAPPPARAPWDQFPSVP